MVAWTLFRSVFLNLETTGFIYPGMSLLFFIVSKILKFENSKATNVWWHANPVLPCCLN